MGFICGKNNKTAGCKPDSTHLAMSQEANAAGFMVRCLPIHETPDQLKNPLLYPQLEQKGQ